MNLKQFSKKILFVDYVVAIILMIAFIILCTFYSGIADISSLCMVLCAWITQLGVSSGFYYTLIKHEHKIELPIILLNDLPEDIKENVDLTTIITTVLTSTDN